MSLILEALRKSEERRRLGETPSLISESAWATRRRYQARVSRRGLHATVTALVLAALAAGAWWWWRNAAPATTPVAQPSVPAVAADVAQPPAATTTPRTASTPPRTAAPATRPEHAAAPTSSASPPAVVAQPLPTAPEDLDPTRAPIDPAVQARFERGEVFANSVDQLRTVQPTQETPYVPPDAALPQPLPDPENPPELAALPPPTAAPNTVVAEPIIDAPDHVAPRSLPTSERAQPELAATTPAQANDSSDAPPEALPLHWQLSADTRAHLPALKLSMHVYATDPAGRFVILDGKRRVEGDPIDQGLRVEAIRRDGVVLSYNGQRFLVARAGQ